MLSAWQQHLAWTEIIQADIRRQQNFLWNQSASVSQAIKAWQLCHDYELEPNRWTYSNDNINVFVRWYQRYSSSLQANNWLDSAQLINIMVMNGYQPHMDQTLFLNRSFTPNQQKWLTHIQSSNPSGLEFIQAEAVPQFDAAVEVYADFEQEIKACANWARQRLEQNSGQTIGIVIPELNKQAKQVAAIFRSVFSPDFDLSEDENEPFELLVSKPLIQTGLISSALNCLELLRNKFDYNSFSFFLTDVHLQNRVELRHGYSLIDVELRKRAQPQESLANLIYLIKQIDFPDSIVIQTLILNLQALQRLGGDFQAQGSAAYWCNNFSAALNLLGWPDLPGLSLQQQQLLKQWHQLLAGKCTGGLVKKQLSLSQALSQVNELAARMAIQPDNQAMIKIIDLEAVSHAYFDVAWISGLNDTVLPQKPRLNPLIPFTLQRQSDVPLCNSESCLHQAGLAFYDLSQLAAQVRLSFFKTDELSEHRVSPLFGSLQQKQGEFRGEMEFTRTPTLSLDRYEDDVGQPLNADSVDGGTYVLKAQSACPFQAYAAYRLKANPIESPQPGLDAAQKGALVHDVLRRIWQQLGSQQQLLSASQTELIEHINNHIDACLKRLDITQALFSQIERQRLSELVLNWLEIERLRREPFTVIKQEYKLSFSVQSMSLDIKIDRIDELPDGRRLIIDYKTGLAESAQWIRDIERIEDPQLPIYFLSQQQSVSAIAFANLKQMKFDGLADGDVGVNGVADINTANKKFLKQHQINDSGELARRWQLSIDKLVQEYLQGLASVTPRNPDSQCQYCQRQSLCRLYQQNDFLNKEDAAR